MLLLIHIIIALTSLAVATFTIVRPSQSRRNASIALIGATLTSGSLLIVQGAPFVNVCRSGIIYFVVVIALTQVATRRIRSISM